MTFILKETPKAFAQDIMDLDQKLLDEMDPENRHGILHMYDWDGPSGTYGYFINKDKILSLEGVKKHRLNLAKRPTGGGIVLHLSDLAFSVIVPSSHVGYHEKTLDNYHYINNKVKKALAAFIQATHLKLLPFDPVGLDGFCQNFCMAKPTIYDVMYEGKKIAGAAQRKKRHAFLHQGSISLALPNRDLLRDILPKNSKVFEAMLATTHSFLKDDYSSKDFQQIKAILSEKLKEQFLDN